MKVILYNAITLNGMLAKSNDSVPFLSEEEIDSYAKFVQSHKVMIVGRRTFELMKEADEMIESVLTVVLTSQPEKYKEFESAEVIFLNKSPNETLDFLSQKGFETVCICGGGRLNGSFLRENLIDEIVVDIEPAIVGKGIGLFSEIDVDLNMELLDIKKLNRNTLQLHYKVLKS